MYKKSRSIRRAGWRVGRWLYPTLTHSSHTINPYDIPHEPNGRQVNSAVIEDMVAFLNGNATGVAIFDSGSSNATHAKRADVMRRVRTTAASIYIDVDEDVPWDSGLSNHPYPKPNERDLTDPYHTHPHPPLNKTQQIDPRHGRTSTLDRGGERAGAHVPLRLARLRGGHGGGGGA